jgi:hypothetical protein
MLFIPPSASAYCIMFQSRVSPLFRICHVLSLSLLSQCVVFPPSLWNFTTLKTCRLHILLSLLYSVLITHAHVLLLHYVSMTYVLPPFIPQDHVLSLIRMYLPFSPSCMTTVDFVSALTSGYDSLSQSRIIPPSSSTSEKGTAFFNHHACQYFCLFYHTDFSLPLPSNMLHFLSHSRIFSPFFFISTTRFTYVTDNFPCLLHF